MKVEIVEAMDVAVIAVEVINSHVIMIIYG